jgi:hypothetical protein
LVDLLGLKGFEDIVLDDSIGKVVIFVVAVEAVVLIVVLIVVVVVNVVLVLLEVTSSVVFVFVV